MNRARVRRPLGVAAIVALLGTSVVAVVVTIAAITAKAPPAGAQTYVTDPAGLVACKYRYDVPTGVERVEIVAVGGHGATAEMINPSRSGRPGGRPDKVRGQFDVSPGQSLFVQVAGNGPHPPWNAPEGTAYSALGGGGMSELNWWGVEGISGRQFAWGAGGGASFVGLDGCDQRNFLAVAGGGGGTGDLDLSRDEDLFPFGPADVNSAGGDARHKGAPGYTNEQTDGDGGDPGTLAGPGAGGAGGHGGFFDSCTEGGDGASGGGMVGGQAGDSHADGGPGHGFGGGGGGGGYYGGGAGGAEARSCEDVMASGGGGGGSSYIAPGALSTSMATTDDQPYVEITPIPAITAFPEVFGATLNIASVSISNFKEYSVLVKRPDGTAVTFVTSTTSPITVSGLQAGVTYTYSVAVIRNGGASTLRLKDASALARGRLPNPPTNAVATSLGDSRVQVTFDEPTGEDHNFPISGYFAECATTTGGTDGKQSTDGLPDPLTVTVHNGRTVACRVAAQNQLGQGAFSAPSSAVTPAAVTAPGKPILTSVVPRYQAAGYVLDGADHNVDSYRITAQPGNMSVTIPYGFRTHYEGALPGLTNGTSYTLTATATNTIGSTDSDPVGPVTPTVVRPDPPRESDTFGANHALNFEWKTPASDGGFPIRGYRFTVTNGGTSLTSECFVVAGSSPQCGTGAGGVLTYSFGGLVNGQAYTPSLLTFTERDVSDTVTGAERTPGGAPNPPTDVSARRTAPGFVTVRFRSPANDVPTSYTVTANPGGQTNTCQTSVCIRDGDYIELPVSATLTSYDSHTFTARADYFDTSGTPSGPVRATPPPPPTNVVATAGVRSATVSFDHSPETGFEDYLVLPSIGSQSATGTSSPITITGLTPGVPVRFKVSAGYDISGTTASEYSAPVTPTVGVPGAPTAVIAQPEDGAARVYFTPPTDDGGSPITGYDVVSEFGNKTGAGTTSPIVVTGLTNGPSYRFQVRATNAAGNGNYSELSAFVQPGTTAVSISAIADQDLIAGTAGVAPNTGVSTGPLSFTVTCADCAPGPQISVRSSNTTLVPTANVVVAGGDDSDPFERTVTVTQADGKTGTSLITLTAQCAGCSSSGTASEDFLVTSRIKTRTPGILGPLVTGDAVVSGGATNDGASQVQVYVNGSPVGDPAPVVHFDWSTTVPPLTVGDVVTAVATDVGRAPSDPSASVTVGKATPPVTWSDPAPIEYGTPLSATQLNASVGVPGTFTYTPPLGTLLEVGADQVLSVTFTPAETDKFEAATKTAKITVTKSTPTITWDNPAPIDYGTALSAAQLNASASAPGTFVYSPALGTVLDAGTGQSLSVTFTPEDTDHYATASKTVLIDVNALQTVIDWSNPADITSGTALSDTQLNATASANGATVPGSFAYSPSAGTRLGIGPNQALSVDFTPASPNYKPATATVHINVTRATPHVIWSDPADIVYGTALGATQLNATTNLDGQSVPGTFTYTPPAGTVLGVGLHQELSVTFVPDDRPAYADASATVFVDVMPAPLTVTPDAQSKRPGEPDPAFTFKVTGFVNGDDEGDLTTPPTCGVAGPHDAAGDYPITCSGGTAANYVLDTTATATLTVANPTTIIWDNPADIVFGTALGATQLNATATDGTNPVPGTFVYTPPAGEVLNAGSNQDLSVTFTPTDATNHAAASKTVQITVTKMPTTITWSNPVDIVYGTALGGTQLNPQPSIPGTFTFTPPIGTVLNAGGGQNLKADFVPTDSANYQPSSKTVQITVTKAPTTITWSNPSDIVYGTALGVTQLNATASVPGALVYTPPAGDVLNAGLNQALTVNFTPTDTTNYAAASKSVQITVTKTTLTVTPSAVAKTYGDADPNPFPLTLSGFVNGDTDTPTVVTTRPVCTVTDPHVSAATYVNKITCSGGAAPNYAFNTSATATLTVNRATLSVVPTAVTKTYGEADPNPFPFAIGGFRNGDPTSVVTTQPVCGVSAPHVNAGIYASAIACSGGAAGTNYVFDTTARATLTVNKATLVVTPANQTKTYGDADPAFAFALGGFVNGDTDTSSTVPTRPTCSVPVAHQNAGAYDIVCAGGVAPNYLFNTTAKARLTINKANLTITPDNKTRLYGDPDPAFTFTASGFKFTDTASAITTAPTCGVAGTHEWSGTYDIVCSGGSATNYNLLTTLKGVLTVTPRLDVQRTTVVAGGAINVAWRGIRTPTSTDWIGLFPSSSTPDNSTARVTYAFTNGAGSGGLALTVPANTPAGSTYELRLFSNNSYTRLATNGPLTITPAPAPAVSGSPNPVTAGQSLNLTWSNVAAPSTQDFIGLYPVGVPDNSPARVTYRYTNGAAAGTLPMTVPAATAVGNYELRLFSNNSTTKLATSTPISVTAAPAPTVSGSPHPVTAGQSLNLTWSNIAAPTTTDWIGLYPVGAADNGPARVTYRFTNGAAAGTLPMTVPAGTAAGNYELRLFSNNSYTKLATSAISVG